MSDLPKGDDPLAGYTPVRMRHPVADRSGGHLPEMDSKPRCPRPRRRAKSPRQGLVVSVLVLLVGVILIFVIGGLSYGFFYEQPLEATSPELSILARPVDFLAKWGRRGHRVLDAVLRRESPSQSKVGAASAAEAVDSTGREAVVAPTAVKRVFRHNAERDAVQEMIDRPQGDSTDAALEREPPSAVGSKMSRRLVDDDIRSFRNNGRK